MLARAGGRCEYCRIRGWPLTIDHVLPKAMWKAAARAKSQPPPGDPDDPTNLVAACFACNLAKWKAIAGRDPLSGQVERLFDPRRDTWDEHFAWVDDGRFVFHFDIERIHGGDRLSSRVMAAAHHRIADQLIRAQPQTPAHGRRQVGVRMFKWELHVGQPQHGCKF